MISPIPVSKLYEANKKALDVDVENRANANALSAELEEHEPNQRGQQKESPKHSPGLFAQVLKKKLQAEH